MRRKPAPREEGLNVNACQDLSLESIAAYIMAVEGLAEVSIGHALVCDALHRASASGFGLFEGNGPESDANPAERSRRGT
jgi:pyridoxine 5-phosphate synthase